MFLDLAREARPEDQRADVDESDLLVVAPAFLVTELGEAFQLGFLIFLPFLLRDKGADLALVGIALSLVFAGGAAGKFACGWLGERMGVMLTVLSTEIGTALAIAAVILLPLTPALVLLPLLLCGFPVFLVLVIVPLALRALDSLQGLATVLRP